MKEIKIKRIGLENFKCHKYLMLDFAGGNVSIYGDNATGKTSVYDALTWLLFGKDSNGNGEKNFEIKPLDLTGDVKDHESITAVEAVLLVNDEEITLRRTLQEVWTTKRGSTEATYDGNTSEYYVNGVPCKKYAFQDKVNELVDEDTFRMLTSVSYFAKDMPWQERRSVLFDVAGVMDDKQIMQTNGEFQILLDAIGPLTLDDFKKKLLSDKKSFVGARNEIPARISECEKTIDDLGSLDFDAAREEVEKLNAQKEQISAQLIAIDNSSAVEAKRIELQQAQLELDKLNSKNEQYKLSQRSGQPDVSILKRQLASLEQKLSWDKATIKKHLTSLSTIDNSIADRREDWIDINKETFTGGNCPTCGQVLPAEQLTASRDAFEANKQKRLKEVEAEADNLKQMKANTQEQIELCEKDISNYEKEISELQSEIAKAESTTVVIQDMEGYKDTAEAQQVWIAQLQEELRKLREDAYSAGETLRKKLSDINAKISEVMSVIGKEAALNYAKGRIDELRKDAASAAEKLEKIEQLLFVVDEFTRYKTTFVEESVNNKFNIARFRLFREQANGGIEDRCDVVYDGVPYIGLNNGAKINIGIDIINTLSKVYGVLVPLFVDNAESVTRLEGSETQIIRLVVSENDKELRLNYEN